MAEMEDDKSGANSEMRYITLELMKIAQRKKTAFRRVAAEFVQNAYDLAEMLQSVPYAEEKPSRAQRGGTGQGSQERKE